MIVHKKNLLLKPKIAINSLKNNGFILVKSVFSEKDFKDTVHNIKYTLDKFIDLKKIQKINSLENNYLNEKLKILRKKNPKKFAIFFDSIQTSTSQTRLWMNKKILDIIETISKTNKNNISSSDLLLRIDSPIDKKNQLKWHQDSGYFRQNKNGYNGINCWAPLTNLKFEMGPLEFLAKSHKNGLYKVKKARIGKFASLQRKIPDKITRKFKIMKYEMNLGDVLLMNMDLIHRSGENISKNFRFSSLCRYHKILSKDFNSGLNIYRYSDKKLNKTVHGF